MEPVKVRGKNHDLMAMPTELTQGVFEAITGKNPSSQKGNLLPVNNVTWNEAIQFANEFSKINGWELCYKRKSNGEYKFVTGCSGWRLPQFSEWLILADSDQGTAYSGSDDFSDVGWIVDGTLHQVALKAPNASGVYDLSGNVREYIWTDGFQGLHLGGEEQISKMMVKTYNTDPDIPMQTVGFRLVRSVPFQSIR